MNPIPIIAGVPLLPPRRPPGQLPVPQGHRLQPEGLRLRLVVQRGLRRLAQLLLAQRRPLLGEEEGHQLFYLMLIQGSPLTWKYCGIAKTFTKCGVSLYPVISTIRERLHI